MEATKATKESEELAKLADAIRKVRMFERRLTAAKADKDMGETKYCRECLEGWKKVLQSSMARIEMDY